MTEMNTVFIKKFLTEKYYVGPMFELQLRLRSIFHYFYEKTTIQTYINLYLHFGVFNEVMNI